MDKYEDLVVDAVKFWDGGMTVQWSSNSLGFGEVSFSRFSPATDEVVIDSECMGREFVKALLAKMVDGATL